MLALSVTFTLLFGYACTTNAAPCQIDVVVGFFQEDLTGFYKYTDDACQRLGIACRVFAYVTETRSGQVRKHQHKRYTSLGMHAYRSAAANVTGPTPFRLSAVRHAELPTDQRPLNEASAYLTHIILHYSEFSEDTRMIFVHPHHEGSWHAEALYSLLERACEATNVQFTNLNRPWPVSCMDASGTTVGASVMLRDPEVVWSSWESWTGDRTLPATIAFECCAQFVTSPSAIRNRSLRSWITYYNAARAGVPPSNASIWDRLKRVFWRDARPSKNTFYELLWRTLLAPETRTCKELFAFSS